MTKIAITSSTSRPACAAWNACAVPEKFVAIVEGSVLRATACTSLTASPNAAAGRRVNDKVTDGRCPAWLTATGPLLCVTVDTALSGTSVPFFDWTYGSDSADRSSWYCGSSSITTQYSLFGV